jgi:hypothetical protein
VDAYGPEEQAMGWYYYLENKIHFPFQAKCIASKVTSPLRAMRAALTRATLLVLTPMWPRPE